MPPHTRASARKHNLIVDNDKLSLAVLWLGKDGKLIWNVTEGQIMNLNVLEKHHIMSIKGIISWYDTDYVLQAPYEVFAIHNQHNAAIFFRSIGFP